MRRNITQHKRPRFTPVALFIVTLLSTGCSLLPGQGTPTAKMTSTPQTAAVFPTSTASPSPTSLPTSTPEPTPIVAAVEASDQSVGEDGVIVIDQASLPESGWLAVFSLGGGSSGELLGYVDLPEGVHRNIQVTIDPFQATNQLIAELHSNSGDLQEFELPEPDSIMSESASAEFSVEVTLPQAAIEVNDQEIAADGNVLIGSVSLLEPGWVVVHADENGAVGPVLGRSYWTPANMRM